MALKRRFVIGDIHGCIKSFREMLYKKLKLEIGDALYLLGDYIDRGPDSKGVLDEIIGLINEGYNVFPLRGNHEEMALDYLFHNDNTWLYNGAAATFKSFGVNRVGEIDKKYIEFISSLKYFYETDKFILAHAGINCNSDSPLDDTHSMLWTRDDYVDLKKTGGKRVISGHTPNSLYAIRKSLAADKIQLDGGCVYYKRFPDNGYLCAFDLDEETLHIQQNIDYI